MCIAWPSMPTPKTDKTQSGWLAKLIADELIRSKDIVIDYKSPDLSVSCFVVTSDDPRQRFVASVALMRGRHQLVEHFPLTADSLESLAHKVVFEVDRRELNDWRRTNQLRHQRPNQTLEPTASPRE
jgi:hypothetical protein